MTDEQIRELYKRMSGQVSPTPELLEDTRGKMKNPGNFHYKRGLFAACCAAVLLLLLSPIGYFLRFSSSSISGGAQQLTQNAAAASSAANGAVPEAAANAEAGGLQNSSTSSFLTSSAETAPQKSEKNAILSSLSRDAVSPSVELSDGILYFSPFIPSEAQEDQYDLGPTHRQVWTQEQITDYLGRDPQPLWYPEDLDLIPAEHTVFVRENEEIYHDLVTYSYAGKNHQRILTLEVCKEKLPASCLLSDLNETKISIIGNTELYLGYFSSSDSAGFSFESDFLYQGIGYRITSQSLSQEEFIQVLLSIVVP